MNGNAMLTPTSFPSMQEDFLQDTGHSSDLNQPQVLCPEEHSKAKEVENSQYTSVPMGIRLKLFLAHLFLFINSVSTEQSQICVMNTELAKHERGDSCWQDNLTHCSSQQDC